MRLLPLSAVLWGSVGCATLQPVQQPAQFIPSVKPHVVMVTYNDNSMVPFADPHLSGDTLVGIWDGLGEPVSVALTEVQRIDAMQRSPKRTALLIAGVTALTAGSVFAIVHVTGKGLNCDYSYVPDNLEPRCVDGSIAR